MPTYEYACSNCGIHLEVVQKMTESSLETCAVCGGKLRKVFHPAGILFKGSGFYATDNRSKPKTSTSAGSEKSEKSEKSGKSGEGSGGSGTSGEGSGGSSADAKTDRGSGDKKKDSKPAKESA